MFEPRTEIHATDKFLTSQLATGPLPTLCPGRSQIMTHLCNQRSSAWSLESGVSIVPGTKQSPAHPSLSCLHSRWGFNFITTHQHTNNCETLKHLHLIFHANIIILSHPFDAFNEDILLSPSPFTNIYLLFIVCCVVLCVCEMFSVQCAMLNTRDN